jgi:hypothetical protein
VAEQQHPLSLIIRAVDKATGPLREVNAQIQRVTAPVRALGKSFGALGKEAGFPAIVDGFKGVGEATGKVLSSVGALAGKLAGLAVVGGVGLYALMRSAVDAGDKLSEMSTRVGLSADAYAQLEFAAAQADIEQEAFNSSMDAFNKGMGQAKAGTGKLLAFLEKVSPAFAQQFKGAKNTEDGLKMMTRAFEKVKDPSKRAALAMAAFHDPQFGVFLGQGSKAIEAFRKRFLEIAGPQQEFADRSSDIDNVLRENETALKGARNAAALALYPALTQLSKAATDFLSKNKDGITKWATEAGAAIQKWIDGGGIDRLIAGLKDIAAVVGTVVDKLGGMKGAATAVGLVMAGPTLLSVVQLTGAIGKLGFEIVGFLAKSSGFAGWALGWVQYLWMMRASILAGLIPSLAAAGTAVWGFTAALLANPITWIVAGVAALAAGAYLVYKNWEPIKTFFADLWGTIKMVFNAPGEALKTAGQFWGSFFGGSKAEPSRPSLGAAAALPASTSRSTTEAKVSVDFSNLPKGARVTQDQNSSQPMNLSMGYSMVGG